MTLNGVPPAVLQHETIWIDQHRYGDAERQYQELSARKSQGGPSLNDAAAPMSSIAIEIANARQKIQNFLKSGDTAANGKSSSIIAQMEQLQLENIELRKDVQTLTTKFENLLSKLSAIEKTLCITTSQVVQKEEKKVITNGGADDDDIDLFGSDEETEEEAKLKEDRLKAYAEKKSKKPALVAKSSVVLDVKPWDDETDMKKLEEEVRKIELDGLKWGAGKLVPLAYGIKKLQVIAIVEDDKVSIDLLQENIEALEDLVQSVDIAAFNKL